MPTCFESGDFLIPLKWATVSPPLRGYGGRSSETLTFDNNDVGMESEWTVRMLWTLH